MHVFIHLLLKYIDFNMNISNGFAKVTATTPLVEIVHIYQCNKTPLKYANTNSKYGHFYGITDYDNQEYFSRSGRGKGWVEEILLHQSVGNIVNKFVMAQYLSKDMFDKN